MGFDGPLYPVNPDARHVDGVPGLPDRCSTCPTTSTSSSSPCRRASVPGVVEECAARGVRGLVVHLRRLRRARRRRERARGRAGGAARRWSRRPARTACGSSARTASASSTPTPAVRLNASLAPLPPLAGRVGFFSQSGALGVAILGEAARRGLGVSTFVSAGNRADVSGNDLLQYWETDDAHRRRADVPRELRQPAQVRPADPAPGPHQADRGRQERHRPRPRSPGWRRRRSTCPTSAPGRCSRRPA